MALFVPDSFARPDPSQKALHFIPPTLRERRAQAIHRLQVGLFGLAGMLLLVGLANIIMDRARISEEGSGAPIPGAAAGAMPTPTSSDSDSASDPLADIGVIPDLPSADETTAARPAGSASPGQRE